MRRRPSGSAGFLENRDGPLEADLRRSILHSRQIGAWNAAASPQPICEHTQGAEKLRGALDLIEDNEAPLRICQTRQVNLVFQIESLHRPLPCRADNSCRSALADLPCADGVRFRFVGAPYDALGRMVGKSVENRPFS